MIEEDNCIIYTKEEILSVLESMLERQWKFKHLTCDMCVPQEEIDALGIAIKVIEKYTSDKYKFIKYKEKEEVCQATNTQSQ